MTAMKAALDAVGLTNLVPVRFFIWDEECPGHEMKGGDIRECSESEFEEAPKEWQIEYERHTVFLNGVSQICLTKVPAG